MAMDFLGSFRHAYLAILYQLATDEGDWGRVSVYVFV